MSTDALSLQIVQAGTIADPGVGHSVVLSGFPNMGFKPFIILSCDKYSLALAYSSNTAVTIYTGERDILSGESWIYGSLSGTIRYAVTNVPLGY
jgi:hypothetical protein